MTINPDWVNEQSAVVTRSVLLSEQTQVLMLTAIDYIDNRYHWDDMTDAEWETLRGKIVDAMSQVLEVVESESNLNLTDVEATATEFLQSSTGYKPVSWVQGTGYDSGNPTRLTPQSGIGIVAANCHVSLRSNGACWCGIRLNGTDLIAFSEERTGNTEYGFSLIAEYDFDGTDYVELVFASSQNLDTDVSKIKPHMKVVS